MSVAYGVFKILCNEEGEPVDYVFVDVNSSFIELTGIGNAVAGKKASELEILWWGVDTDLLEAYAKAALQGKSCEVRAFDPKGDHWLRVSIYSPSKEYFVTFISDISEEIRQYEEINIRLKNVNFDQKELEGYLGRFDNAVSTGIFRPEILSGVMLHGETRLQSILNILEYKTDSLQEFFSNSPVVKLIIDPETGVIVDANQTAADYYGYTIDELRNLKINDIDITKPQEIYNKFPDFNDIINDCFLANHRLRNGEVRDVEVYAGQVFINNKKFVNSIVIDVTARRRVEEELQLHRERLLFIVEGTKAGIWDWDLVTGEIYYDKQWKAILGYEEHEISNSIEEWSKRRHPEDIARINQVMQCCLESKTGKKYMNEYRLRHKNGEYRWILTTGKITRNKDGTPLRWAGFIIDITDRKRVEELLLESKTRLVNFARAIPDTSFIMDEDGRYIEIFHDYDVWLNKSKYELQGRTIHEVLLNNSADSLLEQIRLTIMTGKSQCFDNECHRFGMKRFFEIHTAPMHYLVNGKKTVAVIVNDITERRKTENMLQLTYELRRRSDFFNDIINEKVVLNENLAILAKEMGIDISRSMICCLLMCETFVKQAPTYNNDAQILKNNLIDILKDDPNYVIWDCRDYIGILFHPKNQDNANRRSVQELAYKLKQKIHGQFPQLSIKIGISNIQKGLTSIIEAYKQAISAMKTLRCQCQNEHGVHCCYYEDLGIFQLLTYFDVPYTTKFIEENIGGLIKYDIEKGADLLPTLEKILHSANLKQVAEKMFFHYKTVVLRKRRIEKILGVSLDSFETRVALDAAIKLYKLQKTLNM